MTVVDVEAQSEHFLIKVDEKFMEKRVERLATPTFIRMFDTTIHIGVWPMAIRAVGSESQVSYSSDSIHKFLPTFDTISNTPTGQHKIMIEWPKGTGRYKNKYNVA